MSGELRFRSQVSNVAVQGHVTEAFALVGLHDNMDESSGRYLHQYILAYDTANVRPEHISEMVQSKIIETAEETGFAAKLLEMRGEHRALKAVIISDWQGHEAVLGAREVKNKSLEGTPFHSTMVIGGFVKKDVVDAPGGGEFVSMVEKINGKTVDKLFGMESMRDVYSLMRKGNPNYIQ